MFKLSLAEKNELVTNCDRFALWKHSAVTPNAFTEYGVAMLSSVLHSRKAAEMNVQIIRAFIRLRTILTDHADLRKAIQNIERRLDSHDRQIQVAFAALKSFLQPKPAPLQIEPKKEYSPEGEKKMGFGNSRK
jgi:hypothetical protein